MSLKYVKDANWHIGHGGDRNIRKDIMRAVVFKGPYKVELEEKPIPRIQEPTDVIVKVKYTALCGR